MGRPHTGGPAHSYDDVITPHRLHCFTGAEEAPPRAGLPGSLQHEQRNAAAAASAAATFTTAAAAHGLQVQTNICIVMVFLTCTILGG